MMKSRLSPLCSLAASLVAFGMCSGSANGAVLQFSGDFNTTYSPGGPQHQGVTQFQGTWSFVFDDSQVNASAGGFQEFTIGIVEFLSSDSSVTWVAPVAEARLTYEMSAGTVGLSDLTIAGAPGGARFILTDQDDYDLEYSAAGDLGEYVLSGSLEEGVISSFFPGSQASENTSTGSYNITIVPEPSSVMLLGAGALGLLGTRRRDFSARGTG